MQNLFLKHNLIWSSNVIYALESIPTVSIRNYGINAVVSMVLMNRDIEQRIDNWSISFSY